MKMNKRMWLIIGLALFNLLMLALSQVGSINRLAKAKLSWTVLIETLVLLVMAAIPGLQLVALFLIVPTCCYNFVVRMPAIIQAFTKGSTTSSTADPSAGQSAGDAQAGIWTTPQTGGTANDGGGTGTA